MPADQPDLFEAPSPIAGLRYQREFITQGEEAALLAQFAALPFAPARYHQYTAKRRVVSYGGSYDFGAGELRPAAPIAEFLLPLRTRAAAWAGVGPPERLTHALVAEYTPGTPLGWHRDVPEFELVIGISLAAPARMRFRPYGSTSKRTALALVLEPRSAYVLAGEARWKWQHCVSPTKALRYSVTFRSLR